MKLDSSFRDPAGAVFIKDQTLYRAFIPLTGKLMII